MRACPRCGARNPDSADWCTQCYADLRPPAETPATEHAVAEPAPGTPTAAPTGASGGDRFRRVGEEVEWRCVVCRTWNPVGVTTCPVCGTPFGRTLGISDEPEPLRDVDEGTALIASAILPGAGHIMLGRTAMGVVRAVTYLLWAVGGWILLRGAAGTEGSVLPAVPLLLGAFVLWVTSCWDAVMLAGERGPEVLTPRMFFWLVVGVVGLLIMSVVPAIMQAGTARQVEDDAPVDTGPAPIQTVTVTEPAPVQTTPPAPGTVPTTPPFGPTSPAPVETPS